MLVRFSKSDKPKLRLNTDRILSVTTEVEDDDYLLNNNKGDDEHLVEWHQFCFKNKRDLQEAEERLQQLMGYVEI